MLPQIALIPGSISEMLATVADTKVLTLADRYGPLRLPCHLR